MLRTRTSLVPAANVPTLLLVLVSVKRPVPSKPRPSAVTTPALACVTSPVACNTMRFLLLSALRLEVKAWLIVMLLP